MGPTECKYCGCDKFNADSVTMTRFRCGSSYWPQAKMWQLSNECAHKCAVQSAELREQVQRAVAVLEGATRYDIRTGYKAYMKERIDGEFIEHEEAEQAIKILRGNSSKSSNSSPVTTDDLAASGYFEAVRQRVPWMTAVEHIEGLVEGYRQCGVMVWKAVEHIQRIYGDEHGKTN